MLANENWTRVWDGKWDQPLLLQSYSEEDDLRHIRWLAEAFADDRYLKVDGRPLFLVYRAFRMPDPARTLDTWRNEAQRLGVGEIYLCAVQSGAPERQDPTPFGFDAAVKFAPFADIGPPVRNNLVLRAFRKYLHRGSAYRRNRIYEYQEVVDRDLRLEDPDYKRYPCVSPGFDNSARRQTGGAVIFRGSSPDRYERWLRQAVARFEPFSPDENLFFVNAWNEWAEGCHLEPDVRHGRGYLEATRKALLSTHALSDGRHASPGRGGA